MDLIRLFCKQKNVRQQTTFLKTYYIKLYIYHLVRKLCPYFLRRLNSIKKMNLYESFSFSATYFFLIMHKRNRNQENKADSNLKEKYSYAVYDYFAELENMFLKDNLLTIYCIFFFFNDSLKFIQIYK